MKSGIIVTGSFPRSCCLQNQICQLKKTSREDTEVRYYPDNRRMSFQEPQKANLSKTVSIKTKIRSN